MKGNLQAGSVSIQLPASARLKTAFRHHKKSTLIFSQWR